MITKMFYKVGSSLKVRALGYTVRELKAHLRDERETVWIDVELYSSPFAVVPSEIEFWVKPAGHRRFRRGF